MNADPVPFATIVHHIAARGSGGSSEVGLVLGIIVLVVIAIVAFISNSNKEAARAAEEARQAAERAAEDVRRRERETQLRTKYGDTEDAERILSRTIWVGETTEQLRDSLGDPPDIDSKVLKTKTKEVWKYGHRGGNRYAMRIMVENGRIVGWDEKQ